MLILFVVMTRHIIMSIFNGYIATQVGCAVFAWLAVGRQVSKCRDRHC
jgi:hypothetical protein